jgi:hypothetical protein
MNGQWTIDNGQWEARVMRNEMEHCIEGWIIENYE